MIGLDLIELLRIHKLVSPATRADWFHGGYFDHETRVHTDSIWGTFFLFPTRVLDVFPDRRLPETFFMYGEDMEWCFLLRRAGFSILSPPDAAVVHLMGGSGFESESGGTSPTIYRNRIRFLKKYRGTAYAAAWALVRYLNVFSARGDTRRAELIAAREMFSELFGR